MKRISLACAVIFFCACSSKAPSAPSPSAAAGPASASSTRLPAATVTKADSELPSWITNPDPMPAGRQGKNNCTFAFGQDAQWDFHPDGGCWEHNGPDHLTRQQLNDVH